jgi:putative transposase
MKAREFVMQDIPLQQERTGYSVERLLRWYGIKRSTWYSWQRFADYVPPAPRYNDRSLLTDEVEAILKFRELHPEVGYRKLTWMMNDARVAFAAETAVYQVLKRHNRLSGWEKPDSSGTEKEYRHKPTAVHEHWHTDLAYVKVRGVFYFLVMVLDGFSRFLLHWDLLSDMRSDSVELFIQETKDKYPHAKPKLIHDNGGQFISLDFKKLISRLDIQDVRTRRNHPQTNGKAERFVGLVRQEALRPGCPDSYAEAWNIIKQYECYYNHQRLHAGIQFVRPADRFFGRHDAILDLRHQRIDFARAYRVQSNRKSREDAVIAAAVAEAHRAIRDSTFSSLN